MAVKVRKKKKRSKLSFQTALKTLRVRIKKGSTLARIYKRRQRLNSQVRILSGDGNCNDYLANCCGCCGTAEPCSCCISGTTPSAFELTFTGVTGGLAFDPCPTCEDWNTTTYTVPQVPGTPCIYRTVFEQCNQEITITVAIGCGFSNGITVQIRSSGLPAPFTPPFLGTNMSEDPTHPSSPFKCFGTHPLVANSGDAGGCIWRSSAFGEPDGVYGTAVGV